MVRTVEQADPPSGCSSLQFVECRGVLRDSTIARQVNVQHATEEQLQDGIVRHNRDAPLPRLSDRGQSGERTALHVGGMFCSGERHLRMLLPPLELDLFLRRQFFPRPSRPHAVVYVVETGIDLNAEAGDAGNGFGCGPRPQQRAGLERGELVLGGNTRRQLARLALAMFR